MTYRTRYQLGVHEEFSPLDEFALGVSESTSEEELQYFLSDLKDAGLINSTDDEGWGYVATLKGHEYVEQDKVSSSSSTVFVAMWFDNEMNQVWETIKKAIERAGYEPVRVDLENFDGLIDDTIMAEIRVAKFVIADLTHGDEGHRGSVYYEAGFARGLNKPVIQTVQEDYLQRVAFDLSHHPVISWCRKDLKGFADTLQNRIESRFGKFIQT